MARGFAAGLFQGAVICGAGLVALSLALPQPPRPATVPAGQDASQMAASPGTGPGTGAAVDKGAAPATPAEVPQGPATEQLSVPAGSEFARGSDMQPQMPQPLAETPRAAPTPEVARPADEPAPEAAEAERLRPEMRADAPTAPEIGLPAPDPIDLPAPAEEAPIPVPPPGKVVVPGLDRAPEQMVTTPDNPAASLRAAAQSEAVPEAEPKAAAADPVPGADVPEAEVPSDTLSETMPATDADQAEDAPRGNRPQDNGPQDNGPVATADDTASRIPTQVAPATASLPAPGSDVAGQTGPARAPDLSLPPDIGALNLND